jgi:homoserine kinase
MFADRLHQPYRKKLVPQLEEVIAKGEEAGALGGWLSGSGSGIMCLTESKEKSVSEAMAGVLSRDNIRSDMHILVADNDGTRVKRS